MGKNNGQKGAKKAKLNNGSSKAPAFEMPSFDEKALDALTQRIDKGLSKGANSTPVAAKKEKTDNKKAGTPSKQKPNAAKKRDAEGNVKSPAQKGKNAPKVKGDDRDVLLQEILSFGGTEDDLDLVDGADSDAEEFDGGDVDKDLKNELARFITGLGIETPAPAEDEDEKVDDVEEEVDEDEEWQDDVVSEDEEEEEEDEAPAPAATKPAVSKPVVAKPLEAKPAQQRSGKDHLIFEARPDWHAAELGELPTPDLAEVPAHRGVIEALKSYAKELLEQDSTAYSSKHLSATSSHRFLSTIMTSGTLDDKVSALTLVIQESPVHTAKSFESLLGLAKKRSRGQAVTALGALKDLMAVGVVLPSDRRLRTFATQPGLLGTLQNEVLNHWRPSEPLPGNITKAHLVSWAYEDWLKETYFEVLKVLESWCADEVEFARGRAITYVYELLKEKPEQESNLLRLLVNKLGDPDKKLASRTSYLILQLQTTHPLMKPIIVRAIETELLLKPHQSLHAKYYAINTLNQTILSGKEEEVARKLLSIYFDLFVALLKKPEPPKPAVGPVINKRGQVQGGGGAPGKKAATKAAQEEKAKLASEESTEKMISAVLTGVNRALPFAKADDSTLEKHMDLLFKITHSSNFNTSIQALMLIQQLVATKAIAVDRFYRTLYESLLDPRLITSSKHALYLNLLFRALKADLSIKRVKAFAKRLIQIITLHQPPFICGVLYLIRELETTFPNLTQMITEPEQAEDDDEEVFRDVPEEEDAVENMMHPDRQQKPEVKKDIYDGRKRDPEHSNADKSCLWELLPFLAHFHPSVALFADRLISQETMPAKPDLASHTLMAFLDRFVYRNAKASSGGLRGSSIMQPLAGGDSSGILVSNRHSAKSHEPVNSEAFWRKKTEDVAADEVFFHKYFNQVGKSKQPKAKKDKKDAMGSDDEDENEDEIWQALVESRPEVEGPSDDDEDMFDLDESDAELGSDDEVDVEGSDDGGVDIEGSDEEVDIEGSDAEPSAFLDESDAEIDSADEEEDEDEEALFNAELQTNKAEEPKTEKDTARARKKKFKALPTFASIDDYADMLGDEDEDMG